LFELFADGRHGTKNITDTSLVGSGSVMSQIYWSD
jgi:hypothetical protein